MKTRILVLVLALCPLLLFAQDAKEPDVLTAARADYQKEIAKVTKPVTDAYLKKLDAIKKDLGAKGDLTAALAVQQEITGLQAAGGGDKKLQDIIGELIFVWQNTESCEFLGNGKCRIKGSYRDYSGGYWFDDKGVLKAKWDDKERTRRFTVNLSTMTFSAQIEESGERFRGKIKMRE